MNKYTFEIFAVRKKKKKRKNWLSSCNIYFKLKPIIKQSDKRQSVTVSLNYDCCINYKKSLQLR